MSGPHETSERATGASALEPSGDEMRRLVDQTMERLVRHIESLPQQEMTYEFEDDVATIARSMAEPLPREGQPAEELLDLLFDRAIPRSFNSAAPGYLAYVPGGGLFASAVGDLVTAATNRFTGVLAASPALVQLEANVIRWLGEIVEFPEGFRGVLTSGGSLAAFSALVTARRERLGDDFLSGVLYVSDQAHHSIGKAAVLAGFPERNVRTLPTDEHLRMRTDVLSREIARDRAGGLTPFLVVGNAGTVNTGAIDPLRELAEIAREEGLWFHVDGAYGGFFMLTEEGRQRLDGLSLADSLVLDPHKGLFIPYGTGALLVRDGKALARAHTFGADYLPSHQDDPDLFDIHLYSPELSRHYRGLRVWLPLRLYGIEPFRQALEEKLALAKKAAEGLRTIEHVRLLAEPELSLLAFQVTPPGVEGTELDELNRAVLDQINRGQRVFLSGTHVRGRFVIRLCILSVRTHQEAITRALDEIRRAVGEVTGRVG